MAKVTVETTVKATGFNLSALKVGTKLAATIEGKSTAVTIDVGVFHNKAFYQKYKTAIIRRGAILDSIEHIQNAYIEALKGVARSQKELPEVASSMTWPGKFGRSPSSSLVMATSTEGIEGLEQGDTRLSFMGYTGRTLEAYRRLYGYRVSGYPNRRRATGIGKDIVPRKAKSAFTLRAGTTAKAVGEALQFSKIANATYQYVKSPKGSARIRGVQGGRMPARYKVTRDKKVVPLALVTIPVIGFERVVQDFNHGAEIFANPFSSGVMQSYTVGSTALGAANKAAGSKDRLPIFERNEQTRPYVRKFMIQQHLNMVKYTIEQSQKEIAKKK